MVILQLNLDLDSSKSHRPVPLLSLPGTMKSAPLSWWKPQTVRPGCEGMLLVREAFPSPFVIGCTRNRSSLTWGPAHIRKAHQQDLVTRTPHGQLQGQLQENIVQTRTSWEQSHSNWERQESINMKTYNFCPASSSTMIPTN